MSLLGDRITFKPLGSSKELTVIVWDNMEVHSAVNKKQNKPVLITLTFYRGRII
jgi:hypothetical protein